MAASDTRSSARVAPRSVRVLVMTSASTSSAVSAPATDTSEIPHGTTIVAVSFPGGVVLAGDRRATMGNIIATRDVQKVYITDEYSAAGIAGTAGIAIEMVRLFTVELEHYEKIEGVPLTLDGKVSRLASMVRGNLGAALQGLAAIPLLVGYDIDHDDPNERGRIFSFDVAGDRHEEFGGYTAIGSGSVFAKSSLKKLYRPDLTADEALALAQDYLDREMPFHAHEVLEEQWKALGRPFA